MFIKEKINEILKKRKEKAATLRKRKADFESIIGRLNDFEAYNAQIDAPKAPKLRGEVDGSFDVTDATRLRDDIYNIIDLFKKAIVRFEREYISIAIVGRAKQGKTTFIQSVGNLEYDIIPDGPCSVIHNDPDMPEGKVSAEIHFKEQEELVTIVKAYIEQIDPEYLKKNEISFNKISSIKIGELAQRIEEGDVTKEIALWRLEKIVKHYYEIRMLFGSKTLALTDPDEIKKYIARNNALPAINIGVQYYYNYLAVARADIYCKFFRDCGKIALVDVLAPEDAQTETEEAMLNTVDKCDAAIIVTKPAGGAHLTDLKIYDLLRDNFKNRDIGSCLFYAVNLYKGVNDNAADTFCNRINEGNYDIAFCKKTDCSNKQEVYSAFMQPLLETLTDNMDAIDNAYLDELYKKTAPIIKDIDMFYAALPDVGAFDPRSEAAPKAYPKGAEGL